MGELGLSNTAGHDFFDFFIQGYSLWEETSVRDKLSVIRRRMLKQKLP